jgi:uncharacterized SAM-binding protein YcdF (DUF218 family)
MPPDHGKSSRPPAPSRAGGTIDWDGIFTFCLTLSLGLATLGLPYLLSLLRVVREAAADPRGRNATGLILVFGKRLVDNRPDQVFRARLARGAALASGRPSHLLVILGGVTGDAQISEAQAGERYLRSRYKDAGLHILLEQTSRDTLMNLRNVRDMIGPRAGDIEATLVSSRYHLARIGLIAASLGIPHRLWPAEDRFVPTANNLCAALTEAFYLFWFVTGRGWARITRNRRMLDRVT